MCTPKNGAKNTFQNDTRAPLPVRLIFSIVSLPVFFSSIFCFSCVLCLFVPFANFGGICYEGPSHIRVAREAIPPPPSPRRLKTTAMIWKTFHGLTIAINKCSSAADLFKSLLPWTTGTIRRQPYLIRCNHNWQVSKKRFCACGFMRATRANICLFWFDAAR